MENKNRFTIDSLAKVECPADQKLIRVTDPKVQGLMLRVMQSGAKAFIYRRRLPLGNENAGKIVELNLGKFGDLSIDQARRKSDELNHLIGQGKDPTAKQKGEITYDQLFTIYIEQYAKHETSTWEEAIANHRRYFERWVSKPISKIKRSDVQAWVYDLAGPGRTKKKHGQPVV